MKLEAATKEELIWWIRNHSFELSHALKRFDADILFHRSEGYRLKAEEAGKRFSQAVKEYNEILKPYFGKPIASIPTHIKKRAADLEGIMKSSSQEQRRHWNAEDKCLKMMESMEDNLAE